MKEIKKGFVFIMNLLFLALAVVLTLGSIYWFIKQPKPVRIGVLIALGFFAFLGFLGIAGVNLDDLYAVIGLIITLFLFVIVVKLFA